MPETRNCVLADSLTALSENVEELGARQQTMDDTLQQAMECITANSADVKRVLGLCESLSMTVHDLAGRGARPDKRPMDEPLLSTPTGSARSTIMGSGSRQGRMETRDTVDGTLMNTLKLPRIDVPTFCGKNVEGWIF